MFRGGESRRPTIVSGSQDHTVVVWDLETGKVNPPAHRASSAVNSVALSPDGRRIVSGSDHTVAVWNLETGTPIHRGGL